MKQSSSSSSSSSSGSCSKKSNCNKNDNETKEEEEIKQSPHTLRLLKLLQSPPSSSSSSTHAQTACVLLGQIACKSSACILWDLLGRCALSNLGIQSSWNGRRYNALAIECIGRNLPSIDCSLFFEKEDYGDDNNKKEEFLWLNMNDLLKEVNDNNNDDDDANQKCLLEVILQKGRLLLSSSLSKYKEENEYVLEEQMLQQLDSSSSSSKSSFLEKRITYQRKILAKRLGLYSFLSSSVELVNEVIQEDDFTTTTTTSNKHDDKKENDATATTTNGRKKHIKHLQRKRRCNATSTPTTTTTTNNKKARQEMEEKENNTSLRSLLVSEYNRSSSSSSTTPTSSTFSSLQTHHENPQTLLATHLLYSTFDSSWKIRHGALLSLLSLLKAWYSKLSSSSSSFQKNNDKRQQHFGKWPQDIMVRCLCILALDQFGDYSGCSSSSSITSLQKTSSGGGNSTMVAPIREISSQLLSLLLTMNCPKMIQVQCCRALQLLVTYGTIEHKQQQQDGKGGGKKRIRSGSTWDVRHGAMLAFKYITALLLSSPSTSSSSTNNNNNHDQNLDNCWMECIPTIAIKGLSDESDDVKSTAAQVLSCFIQKRGVQTSQPENNNINNNNNELMEHIISKSSKTLWMTLSSINIISSCAEDLLILFANVIVTNVDLVLSCIHNQDNDEYLSMVKKEDNDGENKRVLPSSSTAASSSSSSSSCVEQMKQILTKLLQFLDNDASSTSIKLSCLYALGHIAKPVIRSMVSYSYSHPPPSLQIEKDSMMTGTISSYTSSSSGSIQIYCNVLMKLYASFFQNDMMVVGVDSDDACHHDHNFAQKNDNHKKEMSEEEMIENKLEHRRRMQLKQAHDEAWKQMVNNVQYIFSSSSSSSLSSSSADDNKKEEEKCIKRKDGCDKDEEMKMIKSDGQQRQQQLVNYWRHLLNDTVITLLLKLVGIERVTAAAVAAADRTGATRGVDTTESLSKTQYEIRGSGSSPCFGRERNGTSSSALSPDQFICRMNAADGLAQLCVQLGLLPADKEEEEKSTSEKMGEESSSFLFIAIQCLLQSPWLEQCEGACILIRALMKIGNNKKAYDDWKNCQDMLYSMINGAPNCIIVDSHDLSSNITNDANIVNICNGTLITALERAAAITNGSAGGPRIEANEVVGVWQTIFRSKGIELTTMTAKKSNHNGDGRRFPVTTNSMRISASIAGTIISMGEQSLPPKLTPIIRSMMTSLKNEQSETRRNDTCQCLVRLIRFLSIRGKGLVTTRSKLLSNICNLTRNGNDALTSRNIGYHAATHFIELLSYDFTNNETLEDVEPIWVRLRPLASTDPGSFSESDLCQSLHLIKIISRSLREKSRALLHAIETMLPSIGLVACASPVSNTRREAILAATNLCKSDATAGTRALLPVLFRHLRNLDDDPGRLGACHLLSSVTEALGVSICPFVRFILPAVMSMMTDPIEQCSRMAISVFATLVRVAPLVSNEAMDISRTFPEMQGLPFASSDKVIEHLIHGRPLPPCQMPDKIRHALGRNGVTLRPYQIEGVSWIRFLHSVNLNGALCDDMGLGKTLQALIGISLAHSDLGEKREKTEDCNLISLVICPSTLVGHWMNEINRFFPDESCFRAFQYTGSAQKRKCFWPKIDNGYNIVVTSYSVLRTDVDHLTSKTWVYCVLDEGHLLKNPKTATARAARRLRCRHKLILTGTPVQNKVHELWAAFDFLMPNFLGTEKWFGKHFAKPIINGQLPGATPACIGLGMDKLKSLHQQVLPFILRREKGQVMKELPPKTITDVPCPLSMEQMKLYKEFCAGSEAQEALRLLQKGLKSPMQTDQGAEDVVSFGSNVLRSLLYLRLICTHPTLVVSRSNNEIEGPNIAHPQCDLIGDGRYARLDCSGKLMVLNELLRNAGFFHGDMTAADNDQSSLYIQSLDGGSQPDATSPGNASEENSEECMPDSVDDLGVPGSTAKCLIFAQFTQSIDVIEQFLFRPHMPSLRYLRLDGRISPESRTDVVEQFNRDDSIRVMLLTTKIGGLGLNLTAADTVIFLEHDWNPHVDLQAMDRAHRIGQEKSVNVYRLVTSNTIEEKVMKIQRIKLAMSEAIVNSDNSTMYSMGTDRLLDLFSFDSGEEKATEAKGDAVKIGLSKDLLREQEYSSLSVEAFLRGL